MHIEFVETQNFRKLKSIRVDISPKTTIFVGPNNSGKTSAMIALSYFLLDQQHCFDINDFTLSNRSKINKIGLQWEQSRTSVDFNYPNLVEWNELLPSLDIWLHVAENEIHYVSHLLPTLDWAGCLLGVRLRFEPKDIQELYKEYLSARDSAKNTIAAAKATKLEGSSNDYTVSLWPMNMQEFLNKKLNKFFTVRAYSLDPSRYIGPENGVARPQPSPAGSEPIEGNPLKGLIRVDKIDANRGFSNLNTKNYNENADGEISYNDKGKLSEQLRSYYKKHIDPTNMPDPSDIDALEAIHQAQKQFNEKLKSGFQSKFEELEDLGYPGVTNPKLDISTIIKPVDGLNHPSALKYRVTSHGDESSLNPLFLPEQYNGLGYQNLISMVFRLMSFRDDWMQVGKAGKKIANKTIDDYFIPPLHLVLVEEPEAHLHAQVQQVFIRKAYQVLRKHADLDEKKALSTQLIVSTHSIHIAHECEFSCLRYFRRQPVINIGEVPVSTVVNLSEVFGKDGETKRFVTRYIKATHCDLFFADAAILVEGPAERMLVPHFIREHFQELNQSYLTLLEIGGSHAHRLRSLIEHLGLITLIITDLDAADPTNNKSSQPVRNQGQVTRNETLKTWLPEKKSLEELLNIDESTKIKEYDSSFSVRVSYQYPVNVHFNGTDSVAETLSNTFEDALVFENLEFFKTLEGSGLIKKFQTAITKNNNPTDLGQAIFKILKTGNKAEFALDILCLQKPEMLKVPAYIAEGLKWLAEKIKHKQKENLSEDHSSTKINQTGVA
jgi:predicted ATP-dependent endonuclease of OLD family